MTPAFGVKVARRRLSVQLQAPYTHVPFVVGSQVTTTPAGTVHEDSFQATHVWLRTVPCV